MKTQVISFQCVLKNKLGQVLSTSLQSDVINAVEAGGELRELAAALQGVCSGEQRKVEIKAESAYGFYNPELCSELSRQDLSRGFDLKVGDTLNMYSPELGKSLTFRVTGATVDTVTVDGNHPLAGQDLFFEVDILTARDLQKDDEGLYFGVSKGRQLH